MFEMKALSSVVEALNLDSESRARLVGKVKVSVRWPVVDFGIEERELVRSVVY